MLFSIKYYYGIISICIKLNNLCIHKSLKIFVVFMITNIIIIIIIIEVMSIVISTAFYVLYPICDS